MSRPNSAPFPSAILSRHSDEHRHGEPDAVGYAEHYSRSHDAVIRVYDDIGNVIETHEHKGDFKEWYEVAQRFSGSKLIGIVRNPVRLMGV